jgi:hypothetical protein
MVYISKILIFVLLFVFSCEAGDSNQLITLRYVKTGDFNNKGYLSSGTIFWATNHTTNVFSMNLTAIETKVGSNWVVQYRRIEPLFFQPPGKPDHQHLLGPHFAGYATLQLPLSQRSGALWRAEAIIQPVLTGFPDKVARIKKYPEMLRDRITYGNTNSFQNPFATNMSFMGSPTVVFSQEISDE